MRKGNIIVAFCLGILLIAGLISRGQNISNKGTDFWVGYGLHQFMETGGNNSQEMILYLSAEQTANVTVSIQGSGSPNPLPWVRNYTIPAGQVIQTDLIPKSGQYDARLISLPCSFVPPGMACGGEGLFSNKAIHITSDVPVVAYAHIYGSASSGATMLIPVEAWGYSYVSLNSKQDYANNCFSWCYVVSEHDSTVVEITPSVLTRTGKPAGVPFTVTMKKGEIYQVMAGPESANPKPEMTGTKIKSVANLAGECYPIAVFSGSSRTANPQSCGSGGGDNDNQQCFPTQAWGKRFLTAPTSSSTSAATPMTNSYKIVMKDPANTIIKRNGVPITGPPLNLTLQGGAYYTYTSNTADYIEADKPIMVGQFMTGGGCLGGGNLGDPEMMFLSPMEQGIKKVGFYRNNREAIQVNYLTLVIPTNGVSSLRIDNSSVFDLTYVHPNLPGYTVVVKRWAAAAAQATAVSDSAFTAITYGLGSVESYGYNAGTFVNNLNAISGIRNIEDTSSTRQHLFTCQGSPTKIYALFTAYQPDKLVWDLPSMGSLITPNAQVIVDPASSSFVDSIVINGIRYWRYLLPGDYVFNDTGSIYVPIYSTHPTIENCKKTELLKLEVKVKVKPKMDFTSLISSMANAGCITDTLKLSGFTTSGTGLTFSQWIWDLADGDSSHSKDTVKLFTTPGVKTIKLTGVTTEGCVGDTTKLITIYDRPAANFSLTPSALCSGDTLRLTPHVSYGDPTKLSSWYWDLGNGQTISATDSSVQVIPVNGYGPLNIRLIAGVDARCNDTASQNIVVYAKPNVSFGYPAGCLPSNGIVQFNSSSSAPDGQAISSVLWNFGDPASTPANPNTSTAFNPTHLYSIGNYTINFSAVTANGCAADTTVNASFNLKPSLAFAPLSAVCASSATPVSVATGSVTNGVPGTGSYSGPGTTAAGNFNPSVAGAGLHTIWYVYSASSGCRDSISQTILVRAKPSVSFTYTNPVCLATSGAVQFTNTTTVSDGQTMNYTWTFNDPNANAGNPNTSTITDATHNFTEGLFNIKLSATTNFGCVSDTTVPVTFSVKPLLNYPALTSRCQNETNAISIANATAVNGVAGSAVYSGPGTTAAGLFTPSVAGFGTHSIKCIFTTAGGCVDSISQTIQVLARPFPAFTTTNPVCLATSGLVQFTNATTIADGQPLSYSWTFNDPNANASNPNTSTVTDPTHNFLEGNFNIRLQATSANGCVGDTTIPVTFSVKPALTYPALATSCENETAGVSIATASVTNGVNGNGVYSGPGTSGNGLFTASVAGNGTHTIWYVFTTAFGCKDSVSQTITVYPKPDAVFSASSNICQNELATITDGSTIAAGNTITSWNWSYGDGNSNVLVNGNPFDYTFSGFGNFTVKLVAISDKNCISDTARQVVSVHALPLASFTLPPFVCMPNGTASFTNTSSAPDNAAMSYQWDFGDGLAGSTDANPSHVYINTPASVDIKLIVTSAYGCTAEVTQTLSTFYDKPVANFSVYPPELCQGSNNVFTDSSYAPNGTIAQWEWNFGDGTSPSVVQNPTHKYLYPGIYQIVLIVRNQVGCVSDPFASAVTVNLQPKVDAGWSFVVPEGTVITLQPNVNDSTVVNFLWTPQGDIIDPTVLHPTFAAMTDQLYTLTAVGPGNCFASDTLYVKILKPFKVPNIFSPNGDNINDKWVIKNLSDYPGASVQVFNRYGQQVFFSVGYSNPWDGTYNGKPLPVGTYYYVIKPRNEFKPLTGPVTIVR